MTPAAWLDVTLPTLAENLALDEALLEALDAGEIGPTVRAWEYPRRAVVLGASSRLGDDVHGDVCAADGIEIGRRSSGGGTVLIGPGAWNAAFVLPIDATRALATVEGAQRFALERIAEALRPYAPGLTVRGSGDLALGDRKCAGSAQRRMRRGVLVHVAVLYDFPLASVGRYLAEPKRRPAYRGARTHAAFLVNAPVARGLLVESVRRAWSGDAPAARPTLPGERLRRLVAEKFSRADWTTRL
jgi:lipoate-protein ligase A